MSRIIQALFVAWRNPETRQFYPVARLAQIEGDGCADCFEFVYIQGANQAPGFAPFLSFPDLQQVYRGRELFPMFVNRLLPRKRSDFPRYIEQLGLPPATISPITILSRSSGRRATDTLELFPLPEFDPEHGHQTWFWLRGIRHLDPSPEPVIARLSPGDPLVAAIDEQNPAVANAIRLLTPEGEPIGYMPTYLLDDAYELHQICDYCQIHVDRLNPSPAPIQQRLLCRLESCWPYGFTPYSSDRYQPLNPAAAVVTPVVFDE